MSKLEGTKHFTVSDYNELADMSEYEMNSKQAIIAKCKECCGFQMNEARQCRDKTCVLNRFLIYYLKLKD